MKSFVLSAILSTVTCVSVPASAATLYVDGSVSSSGDGQTWQTALKTIQEGINKATAGDTVVVAEGTYVENVQIWKNLVLTSTNPLDPAVVEKTVIDGNQADSVVKFAGTQDSSCIVCGFTIRNGKAQEGGGICGAAPTGGTTSAVIRYNVVSANTAGPSAGSPTCYGGGIAHCQGDIEHNTITENLSAHYGGGLAYCAGTIRDNLVSMNSATSGGGGAAVCNGDIVHNQVRQNTSSNGGGGLHDCDGTVRSNVISGNSAPEGSGGLYSCDVLIAGNVISGNLAERGAGGGMGRCDADILNNIVVGNSALSGGGLHSCGGTIRRSVIRGNALIGNAARVSGGGLYGCDGMIQNNTIARNVAQGGINPFGGGMAFCSGTIANCIIWDNSAQDDPQVSRCPSPSYSCIQDWHGAGERNIADDPRFADADGADNDPETGADNDYRLTDESPCLEAGRNEDWMWDAADLDGNSRILPGNSAWKVDIGAYEYVASSNQFRDYIRKRDGGVQLIWTSQEGRTYAVWSCPNLLTDTWTEETTLESQGVATSWTDLPSSASVKFYKLEMR
ncbi:MAG: choice-of-anchor Q domain-containing protein [bacterium]|nr:choice-of-anchor Q domain-containing protein [bacterium]